MAATPAKHKLGGYALYIFATHTCNDVIGLTTYYNVRLLVPEVCHHRAFLTLPPIPKSAARLATAGLPLRLVMRIF